jgi:sulfite reductase beta subunit-like hemoprotein
MNQHLIAGIASFAIGRAPKRRRRFGLDSINNPKRRRAIACLGTPNLIF